MATVVGENIEFLVDEESQYLEFHRTLYVDADDEGAAQQAALERVAAELRAQALLDEQSEPSLGVEEIKQVDVLGDDEAFVWYFQEDELDELA
jgi:hypothetical protein